MTNHHKASSTFKCRHTTHVGCEAGEREQFSCTYGQRHGYSIVPGPTVMVTSIWTWLHRNSCDRHMVPPTGLARVIARRQGMCCAMAQSVAQDEERNVLPIRDRLWNTCFCSEPMCLPNRRNGSIRSRPSKARTWKEYGQYGRGNIKAATRTHPNCLMRDETPDARCPGRS